MFLQAFVPQLSTLPKLNKFTPYNLAKSIRKFPRPKYSRSYATVPVMCVCVCVYYVHHLNVLLYMRFVRKLNYT